MERILRRKIAPRGFPLEEGENTVLSALPAPRGRGPGDQLLESGAPGDLKPVALSSPPSNPGHRRRTGGCVEDGEAAVSNHTIVCGLERISLRVAVSTEHRMVHGSEGRRRAIRDRRQPDVAGRAQQL